MRDGMSTALPIRIGRQAVILAVVLVLALLVLFSAERIGVGPTERGRTSQILPVQNISNNNAGKSNGNHDKHCNDGHGQDNPKNKHCRELSPG